MFDNLFVLLGHTATALALFTVLGVVSAAVHFQPPIALDRFLSFLQNGAAPCALFALGVTVALRPLERVPWEVPILVAIKLIVHPIVVLMALIYFGEIWGIVGALLATPITAVFKIVMDQFPATRPFASLLAGDLAFLTVPSHRRRE